MYCAYWKNEKSGAIGRLNSMLCDDTRGTEMADKTWEETVDATLCNVAIPSSKNPFQSKEALEEWKKNHPNLDLKFSVPRILCVEADTSQLEKNYLSSSTANDDQ